MTHKKHLDATSKNLVESINRMLKRKGIATKDMPFVVNNLELKIQDKNNVNNNNNNNNEERVCLEWDYIWQPTENPTPPPAQIFKLVPVCKRYEDD